MCGKDCFNCKHEDCINDDLDLKEYREDVLMLTECVDKKTMRNRNTYKRFREANLEKERERDRARYEKRKDQKKETDISWEANNAEYRRKYFHDRYMRRKMALSQ